jgi:DHA1 family bicyclomycin/chloramphenicol resistance-like MFS transporter
MPELHLKLLQEAFPPRRLSILLAIVVALTPFAIDMYLPAMPAMATFFVTGIDQIEISIPLFLIGFALGQIIGGPVSDNYGRKPIGIAGFSLFTVASVLILFAPTVEALWFLRFIQAFGGGFGAVIAAAIVRDLYDGKDSAKIFTLIGLIMMVAPLIAPAIGSVMLDIFGWQSIFVVLAVYAIVQIVIIGLLLPETQTLRLLRGHQRAGPKEVLGVYRMIITRRQSLGYLLCQAFVVGSMFAFLTEAPFMYIEYYGASASQFPLLFGANIIVMMFFNRLNARMLDRYSSRQLLRLGITVQLISVSSLLILYITGFLSLWSNVLLIMFAVGPLGVIGPNNMASYLQCFSKNSATANAVMGTMQFTMGAGIGMAVSLLHTGTLLPLFSIMFLSTLMASLVLRISPKPDVTAAN